MCFKLKIKMVFLRGFVVVSSNLEISVVYLCLGFFESYLLCVDRNKSLEQLILCKLF